MPDGKKEAANISSDIDGGGDGDNSRSSAQQRLNQVSLHLKPASSPSSSSSSSSPSSPSSPSSTPSPPSPDTNNAASQQQAAPPNSQSPPPPRQRRRGQQHKQSSGTSDPPADWSDVLGQVRTLQEIARTAPTTNRGYIRQKQAGKLWARERIEQLLDAGTFAEIGSISGTVTWGTNKPTPSSTTGAATDNNKITAFRPSNNIQGLGLLDGRRICLTADDYSIRAGHADGATWARSVYLEKLSVELRLPIIKLVDGSSGGGSVTTIRTEGYSYVPPIPMFREVAAQLALGIPSAAAIVGPAIGLGAARATACHFSVMAADVGALFNAGPAVVARATFEEGLSVQELGGAEVHCRNGTVDNAAPDEEGCFLQIKRFLSYLPDCGHTALPPVLSASSPPSPSSSSSSPSSSPLLSLDPADRDVSSLRTAIPRRRQRTYAMRRIISTLFDTATFFEIGAGWGTTAIAGLARLHGRPCGVIANDPESVGGGAIDTLGAQKMIRHLNLCDCFNLPVVQLVDCPGYAVGTAAERTASMRWGVELAKAYFGTTVPVFSVVVRRCYGVAGAVMVDSRDPHMRVGWPGMETGSLPLEGGVEAAHSHELQEAASLARERASQTPNTSGSSTTSGSTSTSSSPSSASTNDAGAQARKELLTALTADYVRLQNPVRTAAAFNIEEIIDPADTRRLLCAWLERMYEARLPQRLLDRQAGRIQPVFR